MEEDLAPPLKKQKLEGSVPEASLQECDVAASHGEDGGQESQQSTNNNYHVMEKDVGITEYVSPKPGFFAILKQR